MALAVSSSSCTTQTACLAYCKEHNICLWVSLRQRVTTTAAWSCDRLWTKPSQICPTFPFSLFGPSCLKVYKIEECVSQMWMYKKKMFPFKLTIHWNTEQLKYWATKTQSVNIFQFKWIGLQLQEFYKRRMIKTIETLRGVSNRLWNAYVHIYMYKKNTMVFCN